MKIPLERNDVDSSKTENDGQTQLSIVASYGHNRVVSTLQPLQVVNPYTVWGPRFMAPP